MRRARVYEISLPEIEVGNNKTSWRRRIDKGEDKIGG